MIENVEHRDIAAIREHLKEQYKFSAEQIDAMLPSFLATLTSHIGVLEQALAEQSPLQVGKAAHTIKGAFLNLGLNDCAELARSIEEMGKQEQNMENLMPLIAELRRTIDDILE